MLAHSPFFCSFVISHPCLAIAFFVLAFILPVLPSNSCFVVKLLFVFHVERMASSQELEINRATLDGLAGQGSSMATASGVGVGYGPHQRQKLQGD
jgi:hypothetical protein